MSRTRSAGTGTSREKDPIKKTTDQIERVSRTTAGPCAPVNTSRSPNRKAPPGAFAAVVANPAWSCRRAARELGVSVGVVHRWRVMIKAGAQPQKPGRPEIAAARREYDSLQRRYTLAIENPRKGLVHIIRRLWQNPHALTLDEVRELHEDLFQTSYGIVTDGDGHPDGSPIDPHTIAEEALGAIKGELFVEYLGTRAFGRAKERLDENIGGKDEDRVSDEDAPSAYEVQIHERAFQARRAKLRARRRGR